MIFLSTLLSLIPYIHLWFVQGLLHPLQTPSQLILIVSLGFLMGQVVKGKELIIYLLVLIIAVAVGVYLNQNTRLASHWNIELILLTIALVIGLLVVIRVKQFNSLLLGLFVISSGILLGYDSSPVVLPGLGSNSIYNWIAGAFISIVGSTALLSMIAMTLRQYWDGIILRIIGSWIATSALFTLTLSFASH